MDERRPADGRKRYLIDAGFQLRFVTRLIGTLCFYLFVFFLISIGAPIAFTFLGDPSDWAVTEAAFRVEVVLRLILAPLLCTFLCLFFHGILETFRIAGPNHRFKQVFRELRNFRLPRGMEIRKGDYLQDTARDLDESLVALHDQVARLQQQARAAVVAARAACSAEENEASGAAAAAIEAVEQGLARFELRGRAPECLPVGADGAPAEPIAEAASAGPSA